MATVTRNNIGTLHDRITVRLERDDYFPAFEKSLKGYAKNAQVPGFRKGMVPFGMVKKMYGQAVFQDEVMKNAGAKLEGYLRDEKLEIFAQPLIVPGDTPLELDMNNPGEAEFNFEVGLKPEIDVPLLDSGKTLTRYKVSVGEQLIDDEVNRIARRYGKVEERTEVADKEDIIYATYTPCDEDGQPIEDAEQKQDTEVLGKMPEKLQEMLQGARPGDTFKFRPAEVCSPEELEGFLKDPLKAAPAAAEFLYQLEITKVGYLVPRELDVMLFSEVFPNDNIADEAGFRERLRTELQKEYERMAQSRVNDEIYEMLVHETPMQLPAPFLKRWMREGGDKPKTAEEAEAEYPGLDHNLRWTLISDKIIREAGIRVTLEDVMDNIKSKVLAYFGMEEGEEAPWMESYMEKIKKDEKQLDETYRQLVFDRLFEHLHSKFNVKEEEISEEEFFRLPRPGHAHHH